MRSDQARVDAVKRSRDRARVAAVVGVMSLMVLTMGFSFILDLLAAQFGNQGPLGRWIALAVVVYTVVALATWMYWGLRLRRLTDPWAYDPDLDGPDPMVRRGLEHAERESRK